MIQNKLKLPRLIKQLIALFTDLCLCLVTVSIAFILSTGGFFLSKGIIISNILSIAFSLPIFISSGLYRAIFRYSGLPAMFAIIKACFLYTIFYATAIYFINRTDIPKIVGIIQPLLLFLGVSTSRISARYFLSDVHSKILRTKKIPKAIIYGAGNAGRQLASALYNSNSINVVGFVDDDVSLQGYILNGLKIYHPKDLDKVISKKNVSHVLLAIPSSSRRRRNEIIHDISDKKVSVRTLPSVTDIAQGKVTISDLRELDIDDLLSRETVSPDKILLSKNISDKVVLVTGAGGSIGSELCRQIIKLVPEKLLLVEINEYSLYKIHAELINILDKIDDKEFNKIVPLLASVQDQNRINEIISTWHPDTVYHAAAYKHVPIVEHNLVEGVKNNLFGTINVAEASIKNGVSSFVLISTDKAVRPTNVMGATKRLAEICLQSLYSFHSKNNCFTNFCMVRFGNVLGSSGSVIPLFREQIRNGGPITLTHQDITRYFMTIPEAAELVIQAGAMSKGGDVFVLDMGEPVKIFDLAKKMVELSGLKLCSKSNPEGDIEIKIIGLRPGEKLFEELLLGDNPQPTAHPKIQRAQDPFMPWEELELEINNLKVMINSNNLDLIVKSLKNLVIGYNPSSKVVDWVFTEQTHLTNEPSKSDIYF